MELSKEQIEFLDRVVEGTWVINSNGEVDVDGDVFMDYRNLTEIPIKFGRVNGYFSCSENQLTTLKNSPTSVGEDFWCSYNNLTSLEGCPISVDDDFYFYDNPLTNYFKNIKEEDFAHWDKLDWDWTLEEYPFLINIAKKYVKNLKWWVDNYPQTKIYLK